MTNGPCSLGRLNNWDNESYAGGWGELSWNFFLLQMSKKKKKKNNTAKCFTEHGSDSSSSWLLWKDS